MLQYGARPQRSRTESSDQCVKASAWLPAALLAAAVTLGIFAQDARSAPPIKFSQAAVFIEHNATDGDFGIHFFWDAVGWNVIEIRDPDNIKILGVTAEGELAGWGLTEGFFESVEPVGDITPLQERFPAGKYEFTGITVAGGALKSTDTLTYDIPDAPVILSPLEGDVVDLDQPVIITWEAPLDPPGPPQAVDVVVQQVIVEREEPFLLVFSADFDDTATSVTVSPEFLEPGTEYKVEVAAQEAGGNRTFTEITFTTQ